MPIRRPKSGVLFLNFSVVFPPPGRFRAGEGRELVSRQMEAGLFSSANSINIGRLIPQMFYYFSAASQLTALRKGMEKRGKSTSIPADFYRLKKILLSR